MSASSPSEVADPTAAKRSPRRRTVQSGFSLLARGEPQIWFTGGMLVICLVMIVGLLAFILYAGLPTFWPRELHWLVLNDGSLEIGQPQRTQTGSDSEQLPTDVLEASPRELVSRYYRTGNYDLTGQHYRWMSPWELNPLGIARPKWGMVVERLEHGRLYGILAQLTIGAVPEGQVRGEIAALQNLRDLILGIPDADAELLMAIQAAIEGRLLRIHSEGLWNATAGDELQAGLLQVQLREEQEWKVLREVDRGSTLTAARRIITSEPEVLNQLQAELTEASALRERVEDLRYAISRFDARLSELRAEIRRAEIHTQTQIVKPVDSSHFLLEQLEALSDRMDLLDESMALLRQVSDDASWSRAALDWLSEYGKSDLTPQISTLNQQLEDWLQPFREQPIPILEAVQDYQAGYRQILDEKMPLVDELAELEVELSRAEVSFLVPSAPEEIEMDDSDIDHLLQGRVTDVLRQKLQEHSIASIPEVVDVEELGGQLHLASFLDAQANKHVLAIAGEGYLDENENSRWKVLLLNEKVVPCKEIVRAIPVNQLRLGGKVSVYLSRWKEFLLENPREANSEGGLFPAIWGTIVMTVIMTIAVVPFGVMAALYLREYTKSGPLVSIIRISINNLAGVPSIVYGVFGFSFFCYTIGAFIDGGPRNAGIQPWPSSLWFIALAVVAVLGTIAFFFSFVSSGPSHSQTGFKRMASRGALIMWLISVAAIAYLVLKSPFFDGFYREYLPNPTYGKGGLLWAALTLSLLTLPVVIVATEEALAAVPNSLREGSLACGASKWQTIHRIVLPHARPGILTGAILAMARGAGEVAPLMLVGALASAPDLPLDGEFPFFHGSRSFMHLGYQIYTLGFQSQNSEAAKPMVFTCALLLILIVATLNITAIYFRAKLKRQFPGNQF